MLKNRAERTKIFCLHRCHNRTHCETGNVPSVSFSSISTCSYELCDMWLEMRKQTLMLIILVNFASHLHQSSLTTLYEFVRTSGNTLEQKDAKKMGIYFGGKVIALSKSFTLMLTEKDFTYWLICLLTMKVLLLFKSFPLWNTCNSNSSPTHKHLLPLHLESITHFSFQDRTKDMGKPYTGAWAMLNRRLNALDSC